jgi:hypothetical protein
MPVKVQEFTPAFVKTIRNKLLIEALRITSQHIIPTINKYLTTQYERTFAHWSGGRGSNRRSDSEWGKAYNLPTVKFNTKARIIPNKGILIEVNSLVVLNGNPHPLWYWIDFGTKTITQPKTARFPVRVQNRTEQDILDASPFAGFTGDYRTIAAGRIRRGIPPRFWSSAIAEELKKDIAKIDELKGWTFVDFDTLTPTTRG